MMDAEAQRAVLNEYVFQGAAGSQDGVIVYIQTACQVNRGVVVGKSWSDQIEAGPEPSRPSLDEPETV